MNLPDDIAIRPIHPKNSNEIEIVATRMGQTLVEVLGEAKAEGMYTLEWLIDRVRWHLDPKEVTGQVFVAENAAGEIVGHTIVRIDDDGKGHDIGLFGTTYVDPASRNEGVATSLLARGEQWMVAHGMTEAVTYTDQGNTTLHQLYMGRGYALSPMPKSFVKLAKTL